MAGTGSAALQRQLLQRRAIGIHAQDRALLVPVAQHDARAGVTTGLQGMDGRAMGVAVDQPIQAVTHEGGFHLGRRDVGDGFEARLVALLEFCMPRLACRARLLRERDACGQRLGQELRLNTGSRVCARKAW